MNRCGSFSSLALSPPRLIVPALPTEATGRRQIASWAPGCGAISFEELRPAQGLESPQEQIMADQQNERPKSPPHGDERTPDKTQGQIKYAPGQSKKSEGGADEPKMPDLEPEKQGGIGGP